MESAHDLRRWRRELARAGFEPVARPGLVVERTAHHARVEAACLRLEAPATEGATPDATFRIEARHPGLPRTLRFGPEPATSGLARLFTASDVRTHDEAFDRQVRVTGDAGFILAAFNQKTRELVQGSVARGLVLEGTLHGEVRFSRPADLVLWLNRTLDLVRRLSMTPEELPTRLVRIAERHPVVAARVDAVRALQALGDLAEAWPGLLRLLAGPAEVRAVVEPLLRTWLAADPSRVASLREAALLGQLEGADTPVRLAIIERLGQVGTERCLPALRGEVGGFLRRGAVRAAAQASLAQVLQRVGERVGSLTLVSEVEGGLAMIDPEL